MMGQEAFISEDKMNDYENIARIIYMWRRYCGRRCWERTARGGKLYTFADIDELERRIELYFKHKKYFSYEEGQIVFPAGEKEVREY